MMRKIFILILTIIPVLTYSQYGTKWLRSVGGTDMDIYRNNALMRNGNLVSIGSTTSANFYSTGNHGFIDCMVTCTSPDGLILWHKLLGGSTGEMADTHGIDTTTDGNIVVSFTTYSNDGDISGNHGSGDLEVIKLSTTGSIIWKKTLGGSGTEDGGRLCSTPDGGVVLISTSTSSASGDIFGTTHGGKDFWIVKLDASGSIQWQKLYGGSADELTYFSTIKACSDGTYLFAGSMGSTDGDLSGVLAPGTIIGTNDILLAKLDANGNFIWKKSVGGSQDESSPSLYIVNGGFYMLFNSKSSDRDLVTPPLGYTDVVIFKYTTQGNIIWKKQYGCLSSCYGTDITGVQGDLVTFCGTAYANTFAGIPMLVHGQSVMMAVRIDTLNGNIRWIKTVDGHEVDFPNAIKIDPQTTSIYLSGNSTSSDYDFSINYGIEDGVIVKLDGTNFIKGSVYVDLNNNGYYDNGDVKPDYVPIVSYKDNQPYRSTTTANGVFSNEVDTGTYKTKPKISIPSYYIISPDSTICSFLNQNQGCENNNFVLKPVVNINDLRINIIPLTAPLRGFRHSYQIVGSNVGTNTIPSGTIGFRKDLRVNYINIYPTPTYQSGDSIAWTFNNMRSFDSLKINVTVYIPPPPTVSVNDRLQSFASISPISGDFVPIDNKLVLYETSVGSFDPNDKRNLIGDTLSTFDLQQGKYIYYVVRFQNTGNFTAFDVIVKDTLSSKFDANSMEILGASHSFSLNQKNNEFVWHFNNINLPDSNANEPASHGWISYRVKAQQSLNPNEFITNSASIYFDFNPPVITNTDTVKIVPASVPVPAAPIIQTSGLVNLCHNSIKITTNASGIISWYKNGVLIPGVSGQSLSVSEQGIYTATSTLSGLTSPFSNSVLVQPGSFNYTPVINSSGSNLVVSNPGGAGIQYAWEYYSAIGWSSYASNSLSVYPTSEGKYRAKAFTTMNCFAFSNIIDFKKINTPVTASIKAMSVISNPATGNIYIDNFDPGYGWRFAQVYDISGRIMLPTFNIYHQYFPNINVNKLAKGIYYIKLIRTTTEFTTLKFVKQ